jgi:hypothetical protein
MAHNLASSSARLTFQPGEVDAVKDSDVLGREVAVHLPEGLAGVWDLDVSNLAPGCYWLVASGQRGKASKLLEGECFKNCVS